MNARPGRPIHKWFTLANEVGLVEGLPLYFNLCGGNGERILRSLSLAFDLDLGGEKQTLIDHLQSHSVDLGSGDAQIRCDVCGEHCTLFRKESYNLLFDFGICQIIGGYGISPLFVSLVEFGEFCLGVVKGCGVDVAVDDVGEKFSVSHSVPTLSPFVWVRLPYLHIYYSTFRAVCQGVLRKFLKKIFGQTLMGKYILTGALFLSLYGAETIKPSFSILAQV